MGDGGTAAFVKEVTDVVDEMLACWTEWRETATNSTDAYRRWCVAPEGEETRRYSAYMSALDQEEAAAETYSRAVADVERLWRDAASQRT
jgi:hypothetical protein